MKLLNVRLLGVLLVCHAAAAQIITTVAGTDFSFPSGSLPAVDAPLGFVGGVAIDTAGNVFLSDADDNLVMRISTGGTLTVVAGNGIAGFSGDGGPATSASLDGPYGVAVDSSGNLYIADSLNNRIRKVSNGTITTVAGSGGVGFLTGGFSGDGGPAVSATLNGTRGVAVDSAGNLYIADSFNNRIRKVSNGTITTIAGSANQGFSGDGGPATSASLGAPYGVGIDPAGNLYIADSYNNRVRKVSSGTITTIAGNANQGFSGDGGPATSASLSFPYGVGIDPSGNLLIADSNNNRIRKVSNGMITTIAGNGNLGFSGDAGPATSASLDSPSGVTVDAAGNLYLADGQNYRIRKVSNGMIATLAGNRNHEFSGDGGAATGAALGGTDGVVVDAAGNLYIAANGNRIRKVSNGAITTLAGDGNYGFSGDGGPAAGASLNGPIGMAVDSAGNLYIADSTNNRIREVSNGTITTFAGNGNQGYSGDGGPAASASLYSPAGVAVDSAGNLYIADPGNERIREVSNGTITTIAGDGNQGFSGDGGPATSASLHFPDGVAVDSSGDLYIADQSNNRIRKVSNGTITTVAGNGNGGFSGDGGPATGASLNLPYGVAVDSAGNLYIADTNNFRIREVLVNPPFFSSPLAAGAASISLSRASGGKPVTATLNAGITTTESSTEAVPGMAYSAAASVISGGSWLSVSPQTGNTPSLITVTADPLNLSPGTYNGVIVIIVLLANPQLQIVNVQFTVTPAVPASISVDQSHMSFTYATTSAARSQTLIVSNSGGGSLNFTTSISLNSGVSASWLSVTPQSGTATPGNPVALAVSANPSTLPPGTYTGGVTIQGGSAGSATIPITMTITANPLVMLLSQAGLTFTAVQNGGAIPPQTFGVLSLGSGTLSWSVQTSTLAGGNWLNATPGSGSSNAAVSAPQVTVSVNPAGLAPGVYYGLVKVVSAGAANTPQSVVAVLQVLPAGTDVAPIVQPSSLVFTAPAGESSPSSQNVLVYDPTGTSKSFSSGIVTNESGQLVTLPTDATISPTEPTQIVVQPIVNGLSPGTYPGTLTLQFSDGRVNAVGITFVVTGAAASSARPQAIPRDSGSSVCTPMKLIPVLSTLSPSFNVLVGFPTALSAQVMDDCGIPQTSGRVTVTFTNGDPPLGLTSLNNGTWQATWHAGPQSAGQPVKLTVTAVNPQQISGTAEVDGGISASQTQPMILPGGVVGAASPVSFTALAPGGIISIYGSLLADSSASATSIPLPTTLGNTNVIVAGQIVPLYFASPGQINAIVPFGLNTNTSYSVLVQRDLAISSPFAVDIADAQPGAFQSGGSAIVEATRGMPPVTFLVTPSAPAQAGDVLVIYCAGLGVTNPPVADGVASPLSPPAQSQAPVTVSIGGQNANVVFAGLTPTLVGLYQVNVTMPAGVTPGNAVPVLLTVAGQTSPAAIISTQ